MNHEKQADSYDLFGGPAANTSSWSKRESEWFEIEEKVIFKNNVKNFMDGDFKNIEHFIKVIQD